MRWLDSRAHAGQVCRAVQCGVACRVARLQNLHLLHRDRLGPAASFGCDRFQELRRRAEHAAAEYDLLRVEQAYQIRAGHAPELDRFG